MIIILDRDITYKIIFHDNTNELRAVPTHIDSPDMISLDLIFETDKDASEFIKLVDSLMIASDMRDQKMFVRILNRLLTFK